MAHWGWGWGCPCTVGPVWKLVLAELTIEKLRNLGEQLRSLGQRPSMRFPTASLDIVEAMSVLERYGPMCEAMYLMMIADGKVLNVEREVLRGALEVLAEGEVRTAHMEAMLDAAAKATAAQGAEVRIEKVAAALKDDPVRAELLAVLCAAVAIADGPIKPAEKQMLEKLADAVGVEVTRANQLLEELVQAGDTERTE